MKLVIIIIALVVERYSHLGAIIKRFCCMPCYLTLIKKAFRLSWLCEGWLGVALSTWVPALLLALINGLVGWYGLGAVELVIGLLVLFYCLGPENIFQLVNDYFKIAEEEAPNSDEKAQTKLAELLKMELPKQASVQHRALSEWIFLRANRSVFAVLFWFVLLGPGGALLYRISEQLYERASDEKKEYAGYLPAAEYWLAILDWTPARLMGLSYTLVGNFPSGFSRWIKHLFTGLNDNTESLKNSALAALSVDPEKKAGADLAENKNALALVNRGLIFVLALIALITSTLYIRA